MKKENKAHSHFTSMISFSYLMSSLWEQHNTEQGGGYKIWKWSLLESNSPNRGTHKKYSQNYNGGIKSMSDTNMGSW